MKILMMLCLLVLNTNLITAQIAAITESGDQVILFQDGTWKYVEEEKNENQEIVLNEQKFEKNEKATFLVKSKKVNIGVWINAKEWTFLKAADGEAAEFQFQRKEEDLYAMLITEKIQIPIETLKGIAVQNAKSVSPDIKVTKEEYRIVNGTKVLMMQMSGTVQGMKFSYYGYYYSNPRGTIQFLSYTGENLFETYKGEMELLLNGLVEVETD